MPEYRSFLNGPNTACHNRYRTLFWGSMNCFHFQSQILILLDFLDFSFQNISRCRHSYIDAVSFFGLLQLESNIWSVMLKVFVFVYWHISNDFSTDNSLLLAKVGAHTIYRNNPAYISCITPSLFEQLFLFFHCAFVLKLCLSCIKSVLQDGYVALRARWSCP